MTTSVDEPHWQLPTELVFSKNIQSRREVKPGPTPVRSKTIVTTDVYDSAHELLVTNVWHDFTSDVVTWPARAMYNAKLSIWLKKSLVPFSNVAKFKDDEGRSYKWEIKGSRRQYCLFADDGSIAFFDCAKPGYMYRRPSRLLLSSRADAMRDAVVLSFLFIEKNRRRKFVESVRYAAYALCLGLFFYDDPEY